MIDINAANLRETFKMSEATVGIVGHGFVGKAVDEFFKGKCTVLVNDRAQPELQTLDQVVASAEVIFICVPTPMRQDGSCFTGYVEEVIRDIRDSAGKQGRSLDSFVVVVKSTVYPGFMEDMDAKYLPMRLTFSPEFLTEKNSVTDFKRTNRIIVGGDPKDALIPCMYFLKADPQPIEDGRRLILRTSSTTAEMIKLFANGMLTAKVMFSNEVYRICQMLEVDFEEVRQIACLDSRIGIGHTQVPGPDGDLGYGGHCFPKDIQNLRAVARELGTNEKLFTAIIDRNEELRQKKDWLEMKERAVTEK